MAGFTNMVQAFFARAAQHPDRTALIYLGTKYTYGQVYGHVTALANSLAGLGIGPGDRVLIYLPNCPEWVLAWLAILMRGAVAVPLSPIYPARDLEFVAQDSGAKAVFCDNTNFGYVERVRPRTGLELVIHSRATDLLPAWKKIMAVAFDKSPRGKTANNDVTIPLPRLLQGGGPESEPVETSARDLAAILYTGGTIQAPKGVPYTHDLFVEPVETQLKFVRPENARDQGVVLMAAPLFHIIGLTFGLGAICLSGDAMILLPKLNPDALLDAVQREKADSLFGGPALYRMLLEHDRLDLYDLGSLKYCFTAGDVFPGQVGQRWQKRFGLAIGQGYGATETLGGVSICPPNRDNPPQASGVLLPGKNIRLVNSGTLQDVPTGEPGELLVSSDPMVESYWNRPEESQAAFIHMDGRLWYRTGDIMRLDEHGYLYFVDRAVDAIWRGGRQVSASEIEVAIQEHPAVVGACIVGAPDREQGERLKAFVVLKEGMRGLSGQDLLSWLSSRLPGHKIPQYVEFRDTLPKSKVGKLLRRELRTEERERERTTQWDSAFEGKS